eukprot:CAMPEP_0184498896 /NCGR_PEP_ID=MMETSP0113_2-20130426/40146_1 /TAXON_ID=91329 /ORGANISM="Norrisiella sphaerica, Strain BC52" /LENGTH=510 /DNA_ID=CAMNT_0026886613 /DNA_START=326 /DNA_END=1858 /DNA_ORIENTATION=+
MPAPVDILSDPSVQTVGSALIPPKKPSKAESGLRTNLLQQQTLQRKEQKVNRGRLQARPSSSLGKPMQARVVHTAPRGRAVAARRASRPDSGATMASVVPQPKGMIRVGSAPILSNFQANRNRNHNQMHSSHQEVKPSSISKTEGIRNYQRNMGTPENRDRSTLPAVDLVTWMNGTPKVENQQKRKRLKKQKPRSKTPTGMMGGSILSAGLPRQQQHHQPQQQQHQQGQQQQQQQHQLMIMHLLQSQQLFPQAGFNGQQNQLQILQLMHQQQQQQRLQQQQRHAQMMQRKQQSVSARRQKQSSKEIAVPKAKSKVTSKKSTNSTKGTTKRATNSTRKSNSTKRPTKKSQLQKGRKRRAEKPSRVGARAPSELVAPVANEKKLEAQNDMRGIKAESSHVFFPKSTFQASSSHADDQKIDDNFADIVTCGDLPVRSHGLGEVVEMPERHASSSSHSMGTRDLPQSEMEPAELGSPLDGFSERLAQLTDNTEPGDSYDGFYSEAFDVLGDLPP